MVNQKEWDLVSGLIKPKPRHQPNVYDTEEKLKYFKLLGERKSADSSTVAEKILKQNRSLEFKLSKQQQQSEMIDQALHKKFRKNLRLRKDFEKSRLD